MPNNSTRQVSTSVAGRLKYFISHWQTLTEDRYILGIVEGLKLEFVDGAHPIQWNCPNQIPFNEVETKAVSEEIDKLVRKGVIVSSKEERGQYVNTIFTRPKKDGTHRMILNLKQFNQFVEYRKFKMDTLKTVLALMHKNCFMASVDIKDAYYTVGVAQEHQKYLKFRWQGELFQYTAMPMGYAAAPRVFTKLLKPVFAQLRRQGFTVLGYIDDIFIQGDSLLECEQAVHATVQQLEKCGFIINKEKSVFQPSKELQFLGFILKSVDMTVTLTRDRAQKYVAACSMLCAQDQVTIRNLAQVVGQLVSTFAGVKWGPLHYRKLEMAKITALKFAGGDFDDVVRISPEMKTELGWWIAHLPSASREIYFGEIDVEMETDATLLAWGARCGTERAGGSFASAEREWAKHNINALEMLAIKLALKAFEGKLCNKKVLIRSDNVVAVTYVVQMGGTRSSLCNEVARDIWNWCSSRGIWLSADYIAGSLNVYADYESRHVDERLEWAVNSSIFDKLCARFGRPEIDLFASRLNAKLPRFVSWRPEPGATNVNAFSISWSDLYAYLFPPFSLITRCVQKLKLESTCTALLILPLWATQPWFGQVMDLLIDFPVLLPQHDQVLQLPSTPHLIHPMYPQLRLVACKLSGNRAAQEGFRKKLSKSFRIHGELEPRSSMALSYRNGRHFVSRGQLISIRLL